MSVSISRHKVASTCYDIFQVLHSTPVASDVNWKDFTIELSSDKSLFGLPCSSAEVYFYKFAQRKSTKNYQPGFTQHQFTHAPETIATIFLNGLG